MQSTGLLGLPEAEACLSARLSKFIPGTHSRARPYKTPAALHNGSQGISATTDVMGRGFFVCIYI